MMKDIQARVLTFTLTIVVITLAIVAGLLIRSLIGLSVQDTGDALIVNTRFTSAVIDNQGYAVSVVPAGLSFGIDSHTLLPWAEIANWDDATPTGLTPRG